MPFWPLTPEATFLPLGLAGVAILVYLSAQGRGRGAQLGIGIMVVALVVLFVRLVQVIVGFSL